MSAFLIPGEKAAAELGRTHERTFAIELKEDGFILLLKLTPTQTLSIVNGASIEIVIGSPMIQPNTLSFVLNDIVGAPFWISRSFEPIDAAGYGMEALSDLPFIAEHLTNAPWAQVGLFDWSVRCIHTEVVPISRPKPSLHEWVGECRATQPSAATPGGDLEQGYRLRLSPLMTRPDFVYTNTGTRDNLGNEPYVVSTNKSSDWLYMPAYLDEGKHGYYQEVVLAVELAKYFRARVDLFVSPRLRGGDELSDFVVAGDGTIVLVESKSSSPYDGTPRSVRAVERSLTRLIHKAFQQLQAAGDVVTENPALVEDLSLFEHCVSATEVVGLCIVDDAMMVNPRSLKMSLRDFRRPGQTAGPYILEIEDFFGLLARSRSRKHFIDACVRFARSVPSDAEVPVVHLRFDAAGAGP